MNGFSNKPSDQDLLAMFASDPAHAALLLTRFGRRSAFKGGTKSQMKGILGMDQPEKISGVMDRARELGVYDVDPSEALSSLGALATANPFFAGTAAAMGAPEGARVSTGLKTLGGGALGGLLGAGLTKMITRRGTGGLPGFLSKAMGGKVLTGLGVGVGSLGGARLARKDRERARRGQSVRSAARYLREHLDKVGCAAPMHGMFSKLAEGVIASQPLFNDLEGIPIARNAPEAHMKSVMKSPRMADVAGKDVVFRSRLESSLPKTKAERHALNQLLGQQAIDRVREEGRQLPTGKLIKKEPAKVVHFWEHGKKMKPKDLGAATAPEAILREHNRLRKLPPQLARVKQFMKSVRKLEHSPLEREGLKRVGITFGVSDAVDDVVGTSNKIRKYYQDTLEASKALLPKTKTHVLLPGGTKANASLFDSFFAKAEKSITDLAEGKLHRLARAFV